MTSNELIGFGGVFLIGVSWAVIAWVAGKAEEEGRRQAAQPSPPKD
jgi:hypothetical protein